MRKIVIMTETLAADDKWWDSQTKEFQKKYIEDHPSSKYAKRVKRAGKEEIPKGKLAKKPISPKQMLVEEMNKVAEKEHKKKAAELEKKLNKDDKKDIKIAEREEKKRNVPALKEDKKRNDRVVKENKKKEAKELVNKVADKKEKVLQHLPLDTDSKKVAKLKKDLANLREKKEDLGTKYRSATKDKKESIKSKYDENITKIVALKKQISGVLKEEKSKKKQ